MLYHGPKVPLAIVEAKDDNHPVSKFDVLRCRLSALLRRQANADAVFT